MSGSRSFCQVGPAQQPENSLDMFFFIPKIILQFRLKSTFIQQLTFQGGGGRGGGHWHTGPLLVFSLYFQYIEDIQMFLLNMSFISRVKWTIFIFHEWQSHE